MTRAVAVLAVLMVALAVTGACLAPGARAGAPGQRDSTAARRNSRPDFTGVWSLDLERSDFPRAAGSKPISRTDTIVHREPVVAVRMTVVKPAGASRAEYRYVTDGKPTTSRIAGQDVACRAWWQGRELRVDTQARILLMEVGTRERWSLSRDRRVMTVRRRLKGPFGEGDQTLVFVRR